MTLSPAHSPSYPRSGFTLVELAVVLLIVGILLAGVMSTLSAQIEIRKYRATQDTMVLIQEALIGYAIINKFLPCPDTDDPTDGIADPGCDAIGADIEGAVPWVDLGLTSDHAEDAWSNEFIYRVDATFASSIPDPPNTTTGIEVQDKSATTLSALNPNAPVAVLVSFGKDGDGEYENSSTSVDKIYTRDDYVLDDIDDEVTWLSRHVLIGRMVSAGKWP